MAAFSFDVVGSVGGFYATLEKTLAATNQNWQDAPTGSPQITGVNHLLNAVDDTNDFWPNGLVVHDDGTGTAIHTAKAVPEPSTALLLALGVVVGIAAQASPPLKERVDADPTLHRSCLWHSSPDI